MPTKRKKLRKKQKSTTTTDLTAWHKRKIENRATLKIVSLAARRFLSITRDDIGRAISFSFPTSYFSHFCQDIKTVCVIGV
jgi:hypothetical protein